jgi:hypothetical protein
MQKVLNKFFIISFFALNPFIGLSQYQLIKFSSSTVTSAPNNSKHTPGATSHHFYFTIGDGDMQGVGKHAKTLADNIKIAPEALIHIKLYNKYRRHSKLCNVTQIFSAIILVPGIVGFGYGVGDDKVHVGIAVAGGIMAVAGTVGYIYFNHRTDVLLEKAEQELATAIEIYNKYIIDNKLTFEN